MVVREVTSAMFRKVVIGMSGGVDSAVAALLLKSKGFNLTGVFMRNWDIADETGRCAIQNDFEHAQWVCDKLKIPLLQVNFVKQYWNSVFSELLEQYENGQTPNPDILCNKTIKFDKFFDFARNELQADAIATGHYVRTTFGPYLEDFRENTDARLLQAEDKRKDQTFFLCQVPQKSLRYSMFPLGSYLKVDVKKIAEDAGLGLVARKKESMGICFVGKRNFQDFISEYIADEPGEFVDLENCRVVGMHKGFHHWTIGQRVKISDHPQAFFVYRKDNETNDILVVQGTNHPALYTDLLTTGTPHWISEEPRELRSYSRTLNCDFRFQHRNVLIPCTVHQTLNNHLIIRLSQPLRAITEGQFAVLYNGEECLGGAPISYIGPSYHSLNQELKLEDGQKSNEKEEQIVHANA